VLIDAVIAPSNIPGLPVSNFGPGGTAFILETYAVEGEYMYEHPVTIPSILTVSYHVSDRASKPRF